MRRYSLRALLILTLAFAALIAIYREPIAEYMDVATNGPLIIEIDSAERMDEALDAEHAILLADIDWSVYPEVAHLILTKFAKQRRGDSSEPEIRFYVLNLTGTQYGQGPAYATTWLGSDEQLAGFETSGAGEAVWLKHGKVKNRMSVPYYTVEELRDESERVFSE